MILIGQLSLWVALLMAAWAAIVSFAGGTLKRDDLVASGIRGIYATWVLTILATTGLLVALMQSDFSFLYVWRHTASNLPAIYKFTALWGGQAGSLLFWELILSTCAAVAVFASRKSNRELLPYVSGTLGAIMVFFLAMLCLGTDSNPYERLPSVPIEGRGMNPQLQNPGMAFHPPNLYLGYVSTAIPFAFAMAALLARRLDSEWVLAVRRWALFSWFFLTLGILIGMWWAYVELGWSGYWAWDPVENSSLLPWLTTTAFLHSVMIQEKRGMLRKWNVTLVAASFLLSINGTFITRSGLIESVHSFAQSQIGYWFLGFLVLAMIVTAVLVSTRLKDLEATAQLESMLSREAAFLYNNVAFVGITFSVLWGIFLPMISEWRTGEAIVVGAPFFNAVNIPLGLFLLFLTGVGPLIAWRKSSLANLRRQFTGPAIVGISVGVVLFALGINKFYALMSYAIGGFVAGTIVQEFHKGTAARIRMYGESFAAAFTRLIARNRRRYGGYVVHAGIVVLFAAWAGMAFHRDAFVDLAPGASHTMTDPYGDTWTFTNQGVSAFPDRNRNVMEVLVATTRNGRPAGLLHSSKRQYLDRAGNPTFEPSTEVGILSSARQDLYLVLSGVNRNQVASLHINFNPLVVWVWAGGALMLVGGVIVMWPGRSRGGARPRQGGYTASLPPEHETAAAE
jgi:cytochrome c-type biogenesis protein CcmF